MRFFRRRSSKKPEWLSTSYKVTSDPDMTRWEKRYCSSCGSSTVHKIARTSAGSSQAVATCTQCKNWENETW